MPSPPTKTRTCCPAVESRADLGEELRHSPPVRRQDMGRKMVGLFAEDTHLPKAHRPRFDAGPELAEIHEQLRRLGVSRAVEVVGFAVAREDALPFHFRPVGDRRGFLRDEKPPKRPGSRRGLPGTAEEWEGEIPRRPWPAPRPRRALPNPLPRPATRSRGRSSLREASPACAGSRGRRCGSPRSRRPRSSSRMGHSDAGGNTSRIPPRRVKSPGVVTGSSYRYPPRTKNRSSSIVSTMSFGRSVRHRAGEHRRLRRSVEDRGGASDHDDVLALDERGERLQARGDDVEMRREPPVRIEGERGERKDPALASESVEKRREVGDRRRKSPLVRDRRPARSPFRREARTASTSERAGPMRPDTRAGGSSTRDLEDPRSRRARGRESSGPCSVMAGFGADSDDPLDDSRGGTARRVGKRENLSALASRPSHALRFDSGVQSPPFTRTSGTISSMISNGVSSSKATT